MATIKEVFFLKHLILNWRRSTKGLKHIKTVENKLAKNVGLLYCAKQFLNETSFKTMYFSYIH